MKLFMSLHLSGLRVTKNKSSFTTIICIVIKFECHFMLPYGRVHKAALYSQSFVGCGPRSPAAVQSLGAASSALSSPLYPAGPFLRAAGLHPTSSQPWSCWPDTIHLIGSHRKGLISHGCTFKAAFSSWLCL